MSSNGLGHPPLERQFASPILVLANMPPGTSCPYPITPYPKPAPVSIMKKEPARRTSQSLPKELQVSLNTQQVPGLQATEDTVAELRPDVIAIAQKVGIRVLTLHRIRVPIFFPPP